MANYDFILASASPRRKQLLTDAGYKFKIVVSDIDESSFENENLSPAEFTKLLAVEKAKAVAKNYPETLTVGADTIVELNGKIYGKPVDAAHAERIVTDLFNSPHKVITALALIRIADKTEVVAIDTTIVYPKKMTKVQIAEHIKTATWQDKAGAYAIQETGDKFVEKIEGSLTNVMGMPMELFARLFRQLKQ